MNSDFVELLRLFNDKKVKYLVVGGYAVIKYAQPRYTGDIDIWIEASEENGARVFQALRDFGAPIDTLTSSDFALTGFFFQMGVPPNRIDILMSLKGISFSDAWNRRVPTKVEGSEFFFISKADLKLAKKAVGRPKDIADLEALNQSDEI